MRRAETHDWILFGAAFSFEGESERLSHNCAARAGEREREREREREGEVKPL